MAGEEGTDSAPFVPDAVVEVMQSTAQNVKELEAHVLEFLSLAEPDVLAELPPLQRAQSLLLLAKATLALFTVRLRCTGVHPDDHAVKSEIERLSWYEDKLERFMDLNKAPLRPSTTLNYRAATRFIEHSLPDLTSDQKQSMRDISRGVGQKIGYQDRGARKRMKYQSSGNQSVQAAAKDFLEKAARELLGDNNGGVKGPLCNANLDEDDMKAV
uniref:Nuclear nucleic acid-binding protein C1D n=1 Tax=Kalanchoe fedtschenkoi TaxID=63787 RepID=A0A7N0TAA8_KALFE